MKEVFHVKLRFDRLSPRLERMTGRRMSNGDVLQWLLSFGFWMRRGGLYGSRCSIALLDPDEIIWTERVAGGGGTSP
jgi:hypothetical protein